MSNDNKTYQDISVTESNNNENIIIDDDNILYVLSKYLLDFSITEISDETRFWMIRTKKGYFYNEFISKKFVALAWNNITHESDFSESSHEFLCDDILVHYPEIKRPNLVINKCKSFISDIKENDILVIPSDGSKYITFAYAGEYYEETTKTIELERTIIKKIDDSDVMINDVSCPYRKRRRITPIRTIKNEELNYHLYKAISSYHGISNFDNYANIVLDHLFNCYTYNHNTRLVFHVNKTDAITSSDFSGFIYSVNCILKKTNIQKNKITTQASVHSIGDIVFNICEHLSDNHNIIIGLLLFIGGGKFLTLDFPGIPKIIKDFLSIDSTKRKEMASAELAELELKNKKIELLEKELELRYKLANAGLSIEDANNLEQLAECCRAMEISPLDNSTQPTICEQNETPSDDEEKTQ